jgi:HD-GYP domain-containing protein (c-di-GMP phosphodiesterase class II)
MFKCNFRQITYALSEALDYVGVDDHYHGKRVAYMAAQLAQGLKLTQNKIDDLINIGMLHDCGVSCTQTHNNLVNQLDWSGSQDHCERGALLLKKVSSYKDYAEIIYYHHTHWDTLTSLDIDETTKISANIIFLVDRVDALRAQGLTHEEIIVLLRNQSDKMFAANLIENFIKVSKPDSFWFYLEHDNLEIYLHEWVAQHETRNYDYALIKEVALFFSDIIDAKSPFTSDHSFKVARIATFLAKKSAFKLEQIQNIELAGLFHDLGKLKVNDEILNKQGPLDTQERTIMNRHGFDSEMILRQIDAFKEIAILASMHHEFLDGNGYPYQREASTIPLEARILTIADIFQALVQNRPYREGLSADKTLKIMEEMLEEGKLDQSIMIKVRENLSEIYALAQ